MSCTGTPSVMQTIKGTPASAASSVASAASARRHENHGAIGPGRFDGLRHGVEHRHLAIQHPFAAFPGTRPGDQARAVVEHLAGVELALAAGDALDQEPGLLVDEDAHACGLPSAAATALRAASIRELAVDQLGLGQKVPTFLLVRPDQACDKGDLGLDLLHRAQDAPRHFIATGDPAEDVEQDGPHFRLAQDQLQRGGDFLRPRTASDVEEVGRLASAAAR